MSTHSRLTVGFPFPDPEDHVATPLPRAYVDEYAPLFSRSEKTHTVRRVIEQVAGTDATALVRGESGGGRRRRWPGAADGETCATRSRRRRSGSLRLGSSRMRFPR